MNDELRKFRLVVVTRDASQALYFADVVANHNRGIDIIEADSNRHGLRGVLINYTGFVYQDNGLVPQVVYADETGIPDPQCKPPMAVQLADTLERDLVLIDVGWHMPVTYLKDQVEISATRRMQEAGINAVGMTVHPDLAERYRIPLISMPRDIMALIGRHLPSFQLPALH